MLCHVKDVKDFDRLWDARIEEKVKEGYRRSRRTKEESKKVKESHAKRYHILSIDVTRDKKKVRSRHDEQMTSGRSQKVTPTRRPGEQQRLMSSLRRNKVDEGQGRGMQGSKGQAEFRGRGMQGSEGQAEFRGMQRDRGRGMQGSKGQAEFRGRGWQGSEGQAEFRGRGMQGVRGKQSSGHEGQGQGREGE
ncbi:serine/arginine-rich splicing factor 4-like [Penaeus vannamei]|uniref:serine/arginine-rich splicing factor 4-like n=1 Tax=Penaeus vannamei TaxID=6689 RepID=UPI00387F4D03